MKHKITALLLLFILSCSVHAGGLKDRLGGLLNKDKDNEQSSQSESSINGLSQTQTTEGLKQALAKGVTFAIETLGKEDGFLGDELVRIALPDQLETVAKAARKLGQDKYVDQFQVTMNRAAEQAVPEAAEIFATAIKDMSVEDAINIVRGPDDAATQYFRSNSEEALREKLHPIVVQATDSAGVTQAYKKLESRGSSFLSKVGRNDDLDLDSYVADKTMDGLFYYIAEQEKQIRENPIERTTDLLRSLFGGGD